MRKALLVWRRNGLTRSFAAKETKDEELTEAGSDVAEQVTGDGRPESLAGQRWLGRVLLSFSVAGLPLVLFVLRRLGRRGGLLVEAGCGTLFIRDSTMAATGTPAKLRPLSRLLLFAEIATSGVATVVGFWAWVWRPFVSRSARKERATKHAARKFRRGTPPRGQAVVRAASVAAAVTFVLHAAREAIYLSPGHGLR